MTFFGKSSKRHDIRWQWPIVARAEYIVVGFS